MKKDRKDCVSGVWIARMGCKAEDISAVVFLSTAASEIAGQIGTIRQRVHAFTADPGVARLTTRSGGSRRF